MIVLTAFFLMVSAALILSAGLPFMWYVWAGELVFFFVFILLALWGKPPSGN